MKLPYRARPGVGFSILVVAVAASIIFFGWGWSRPALDRVWQMQLELQLGTRQALASDERRLLESTLASYPLLAANMLEDAVSGIISAELGGMVDLDYAYVVRQTADAPAMLSISSPTGAPLSLVVSTTGSQITGMATNGAPFVATLPNSGRFPQLSEVRLVAESGGNAKVRPMMIELAHVQD